MKHRPIEHDLAHKLADVACDHHDIPLAIELLERASRRGCMGTSSSLRTTQRLLNLRCDAATPPRDRRTETMTTRLSWDGTKHYLAGATAAIAHGHTIKPDSSLHEALKELCLLIAEKRLGPPTPALRHGHLCVTKSHLIDQIREYGAERVLGTWDGTEKEAVTAVEADPRSFFTVGYCDNRDEQGRCLGHEERSPACEVRL